MRQQAVTLPLDHRIAFARKALQQGPIEDRDLAAVVPYHALLLQLARRFGDAFAPRSLQHAILEGHQYARDL